MDGAGLGSLGVGAAGAGLGEDPSTTMYDRQKQLETIAMLNGDRDPADRPGATMDDAAEPEVMSFTSLPLYGLQQAGESIAQSVGDTAYDWLGSETARDIGYSVGDAIGPSDEKDAAYAARATPDRSFLGEAADAIATESGTMLGTIGAATATGAAIGTATGVPVLGTVGGALVGGAIGFFRTRDESRDKAKLYKAQQVFGENPTQEQIDAVELNEDELHNVDLAAGMSGMLDTAVPARIAGKIIPGLTKQLGAKALMKQGGKAIGKAVAVDGLIEGGTEVGQLAIQEMMLNPELRSKLDKDGVAETMPWIIEHFGREAALNFAAGFGLGGGVSIPASIHEQNYTNAKRKNDIEKLATAGEHAAVDIEEFENAARDPKRVGQLAQDADEIRASQVALEAAKRERDEYAAKPEEERNPEHEAELNGIAERAQKRHNDKHDAIMPRYGGMTTGQIEERRSQIETEFRNGATERARANGYELDDDADPATVHSVMNPLEEAKADYDAATKKRDNTTDERFRNKYAKEAEVAKAKVRAAEINARKTLYGESPNDAANSLDREAGIRRHRERLFGDEADPVRTIASADEVIAARSNTNEASASRLKSREKIARLYDERDNAQTETQIQEIETKIAKEQAKLKQPDPLVEAATRAKRDAQKALGIEPSAEELADPMAGIATGQGPAQSGEAKGKPAAGAGAATAAPATKPNVNKPKFKPAPVRKPQFKPAPQLNQLEMDFSLPPQAPDAKPSKPDIDLDPEQLELDFDAPAQPITTEEAKRVTTPAKEAGRARNTTEDGHVLPEEHEKYFDLTSDTVAMPMDGLQPMRQRLKGIKNAGQFMREAYDGKKARRSPVLVRDNGDGTHTVLDGNSTYANAKQAGWKKLPVRVIDDHQYKRIVADKIAKKTGLKASPEGEGVVVKGPKARAAELRAMGVANGVPVSYEATDPEAFDPIGLPFPPDAPERKGPRMDRTPWLDLTDKVGSDATYDDVVRWIDEHGQRFEYAAVFDKDGKLRGFGTHMNPNAVAMPSMLLDPITDGGVMLHSHPIDSPFSLQDIRMAHLGATTDGVTVSRVRLPGGRQMQITADPEAMGLRTPEQSNNYFDALQGWLWQNIPTNLSRISENRVAQETALQVLDAQRVLSYDERIDSLSADEQEIVDDLVEKALANPRFRWAPTTDAEIAAESSATDARLDAELEAAEADAGAGSQVRYDQSRNDDGDGTSPSGPKGQSGPGRTARAVGNAAAPEGGSGQSQDRLTPKVTKTVVADARIDPIKLKEIKASWKDNGGERLPTVEAVLDAAKGNDASLRLIGDEVEAATGAIFHKGPIKTKASIDRKLVEKGGSPGSLGDVVRGGFVTSTLRDSDEVAEALAKAVEKHGGKMFLEDWGVTPAGYTDRAAVIQMPDGQMVEIQFWEPHMFYAKEGVKPDTGHGPDAPKAPFTTGHHMYEIARDPKSDPADVAKANEGMRQLYGSALSLADQSIQDLVLGRDPSLLASSGNRLRQSLSNLSLVDGKAKRPNPAARQASEPSSYKKTEPPTSTTASPSDEKNRIKNTPVSKNNDTSEGVAQARTYLVKGVDEEAARFGVPKNMRSMISPIYSGDMPSKKSGSNAASARWLEDQYKKTGRKPITDFTKPLSDEDIDAIARVGAAEVALALQKTGNAHNWYTGAMRKAMEVAAKRWPILMDDAAAAELGLGNANNARFVFTYLMASTSQNLDVRANAKQTMLGFDDFIRAAKQGQYRLDKKFASGDKQKSMGKNLSKFGQMLKVAPGANVAEKLTYMDDMFREKKSVKEWMATMKRAKLPYTAPGQTLKDTEVYGSSTLGPKIGNGFWQNLNDNYMPVTIDLWMRRTWGRMTGKSIGNESAFPKQINRLRTSSRRSFQMAGANDVLEQSRLELDELRRRVDDIAADDSYPTQKAKDAALRSAKRDIKLLEDIIPDIANFKVSEPWPDGIDKDPVKIIAYAKRILKPWDIEYKRLQQHYKDEFKRTGEGSAKVPDELKPTWAKAASSIVASQNKPLDQVGNGTQRAQIERFVDRTRELLAEQGIEVTPADMQAILWYPEKDLWNSLNRKLEVDDSGKAVVQISPLNESYDTAFEKLFAEEAANAEQGTEGDPAGQRGSGTQPLLDAGFDPNTDPTGRLGEGDEGDRGPEETRAGESDPDARIAFGTDVAFGRETFGQSWLNQELGVKEITPEQAQKLVDETSRITGVEAGPLRPARGGWFNTVAKQVETEPSSLITLETEDPAEVTKFAAVLGHMGGQHSVMTLNEGGTPDASIYVVSSKADPTALFEAAHAVDPDMFQGFSATPEGIILMVPHKYMSGTPDEVYRALMKGMHDAGHTAEIHTANRAHAFVGAETDEAGQGYSASLGDAAPGMGEGYLGRANQFARTVFGSERQGSGGEEVSAPQPGTPVPLYVSRDVTDDGGLRQWATDAGLEGVLPLEDMHLTVTYSKAPVDVGKAAPKTNTRQSKALGKAIQLRSALAMPLSKGTLQPDHKRYRAAGASHDYGSDYTPHITIKYNPTPEDIAKLDKAKPFTGTVKLGPEKQATLKPGSSTPTTDEGEAKYNMNAVSRSTMKDVNVPDYLDVSYRDTRDLMGDMIDVAKNPKATIRTAIDTIEDGFFNGFAPIRRLETAVMGKVGIGMESAYKAAEVAVNDSGRQEAILYYGAGKLGQHGEFQTAPGTKGLRTIFDDVAKSGGGGKGGAQALTDWMSVMAAKRAQGLHARGIVTPLTPADIAAALAKDTPAFRQASADWKKHNDANIDFLVDTGRITGAQALAMKAEQHYVPFYRSDSKMANGNSPEFSLDEYLGVARAGRGASGGVLKRDPGIKKIVGGDKKAIDNLMMNMIRNSQAMVAAGMRNQAANKTFDLMEMAGLATTTKATKTGKSGNIVRKEKPPNSVRMWINGKERFAIVDEQGAPLVAALGGLHPRQRSGIENLLIKAAAVFRQGITITPAFMARNAIRGMVSTGVMTSGANIGVKNNFLTGFVDAMRQGDATRAFKHTTGMGDYRFGNEDAGFGPNDILVEYGLAPKTLMSRLRKGLDTVEKVGTATELADRVAAYKTWIANGVRPDEAAYQALTIMNYGRRGNSGVVQVMTPMIPFLNARLQGLSRMMEGAVGRKGALGRRQAMMQMVLTGSVLSAASLALWAWNNGDDEDREKYLAEPAFRRLNYHPIYAGDTTFYIPKAFELGSVFSTIPEMIADAMYNDMGDQLAPDMKSILLQTFGFNAIPAAATPIVEGLTNYSFFRQGPIEGMREGKLKARDRTTGASPLSIFVGQKLGISDATKVSPTMIEHYMQGYGGVYYSLMSSTFEMVGHEMGLVPSTPQGAMGDIPVASALAERSVGSMVKSQPLQSTKYVGDFYNAMDNITQIYSSAKEAATNGDVDYARSLLAQVPGLDSARKLMNKAAPKMTELNAAIRVTRMDKTLTRQQKAEKLGPLTQARNLLSQQIVEVVKQIEEQQGSTFKDAA